MGFSGGIWFCDRCGEAMPDANPSRNQRRLVCLPCQLRVQRCWIALALVVGVVGLASGTVLFLVRGNTPPATVQADPTKALWADLIRTYEEQMWVSQAAAWASDPQRSPPPEKFPPKEEKPWAVKKAKAVVAAVMAQRGISEKEALARVLDAQQKQLADLRIEVKIDAEKRREADRRLQADALSLSYDSFKRREGIESASDTPRLYQEYLQWREAECERRLRRSQ